MGFFAMLGALRDVDVSQLEEISGASAGAILGLFLCLGFSVSDILERTVTIDFAEFTKPDLVSLMTRYGLFPIEPIKKKLIEIIGSNPTFQELPKKLYVSAFCLNTNKTEYFSSDTVPGDHVIDFICMSIAVPFMFESVTYRNHFYVDGGLVETVPMTPFLSHRVEDVLALRLIVDEDSSEITTFKEFSARLIQSGLRRITYKHVTGVPVASVDI